MIGVARANCQLEAVIEARERAGPRHDITNLRPEGGTTSNKQVNACRAVLDVIRGGRAAGGVGGASNDPNDIIRRRCVTDLPGGGAEEASEESNGLWLS